MSERDMHPVDELLLRFADSSGPSEADTQESRSALTKAIASEKARRLRGAPWKRPLLAVGAVLIGVIISIVATQAPNPTPAQAALLEIARAADSADPFTIPDQYYAYTYSESRNLSFSSPDQVVGRDIPLAAIFPEVRETWSGQDGTVQIRTTIGAPIFFSDQDKKEFYSAGLDVIEHVGETTTRTYTVTTSALDDADWSDDPIELLKQIKSDLGRRASDTKIVQFTLDLLRETGAPPALRASALRVVSDINGITIVNQTTSTTTFQIEFKDQGTFQLEFVIDDSGQLLAERLVNLDGDPELGIPPNTPWRDTNYQPVIAVKGLTTP